MKLLHIEFDNDINYNTLRVCVFVCVYVCLLGRNFMFSRNNYTEELGMEDFFLNLYCYSAFNVSYKVTSIHENMLRRMKGKSKTNGNDNNYRMIIITETTLERGRDALHKLRRGELRGMFIHSGRFRVSSRSRPEIITAAIVREKSSLKSRVASS